MRCQRTFTYECLKCHISKKMSRKYPETHTILSELQPDCRQRGRCFIYIFTSVDDLSLGIFGNFTHRTLRNRASTDFLLGLAYLQDQFASGRTRKTTVRNFSIFDSFTNIYVPLGPL